MSEIEEIEAMLTAKGLGYAAENFRSSGITTLVQVSNLSYEDFETLKINSFADRKVLYQLTKDVSKTLLSRSSEEMPAPHPAASAPLPATVSDFARSAANLMSQVPKPTTLAPSASSSSALKPSPVFAPSNPTSRGVPPPPIAPLDSGDGGYESDDLLTDAPAPRRGRSASNRLPPSTSTGRGGGGDKGNRRFSPLRSHSAGESDPDDDAIGDELLDADYDMDDIGIDDDDDVITRPSTARNASSSSGNGSGGRVGGGSSSGVSFAPMPASGSSRNTRRESLPANIKRLGSGSGSNGGGGGASAAASKKRMTSAWEREVMADKKREAAGRYKSYAVELGSDIDDDDDEVSQYNDSNSGVSAAPTGAGVSGDAASPVATGEIIVIVRKRPMAKSETNKREVDVMDRVDASTLLVNEPKSRVDLTRYVERHEFMFDEVFDDTSSTRDIYERNAKGMVGSIFQGRKATCFAYGQTGSGKTFTYVYDTSSTYRRDKASHV